MTTVDSQPDDGRRYALTGPRGVSELVDRLNPHAEHHTVTVYGSADLARRLQQADRVGVCVAFRRLDDPADRAGTTGDNADGW